MFIGIQSAWSRFFVFGLGLRAFRVRQADDSLSVALAALQNTLLVCSGEATNLMTEEMNLTYNIITTAGQPDI